MITGIINYKRLKSCSLVNSKLSINIKNIVHVYSQVILFYVSWKYKSLFFQGNGDNNKGFMVIELFSNEISERYTEKNNCHIVLFIKKSLNKYFQKFLMILLLIKFCFHKWTVFIYIHKYTCNYECNFIKCKYARIILYIKLNFCQKVWRFSLTFYQPI